MLTVADVLRQAANTAKLTGSDSVDSVWEYTYHTFVCDGNEDGFAFTLEDLEAAFDKIVEEASIAGEALPDYILRQGENL